MRLRAGYRASQRRGVSLKTIILDIETWTPDWNEGENGWEEGSFAPTAFHEPVVISWMIAERTSQRVGSEVETSFDLGLKSARVDKTSERIILEGLRDDFASADRLVTWNGRGFDMPVLSCRALFCGIDWAWWQQWRHRFGNYKQALKHYDLLDQLGDYGAARGLRQDRVAKLCGLPGKTDIDGSMVHALWAGGKEEDRDRIQRYCEQDVKDLWRIYLRYGKCFFGIPDSVLALAEEATEETFG